MQEQKNDFLELCKKTFKKISVVVFLTSGILFFNVVGGILKLYNSPISIIINSIMLIASLILDVYLVRKLHSEVIEIAERVIETERENDLFKMKSELQDSETKILLEDSEVLDEIKKEE